MSCQPRVFAPRPVSSFRRYGKLVVASAAGYAGAASAAIDVTSVTTVVTEGVAAAAVIGLAFLGFKAGIAIYKSLRSAA